MLSLTRQSVGFRSRRKMSRAWLLIVLCAHYILTAQGANDTHYRGAVVEYSPILGNVSVNVEMFEYFIGEAKKEGADIIVFPEIGLNGYGECHEDMLTEVPHPLSRIAPCDPPAGTNYSTALQQLSAAAKTNSIYVVVNLAEVTGLCPGCPKPYYLKYNTNVVFDRNGTVIARYRKYNLFGEVGTNRTDKPELAFFDTDFGVRFGTFICFDLMFDKPALQLVEQMDIRDYVFSTAWFSELPFLTAVQAQHMWTYATDVNFLGAGYNDPAVGSAGSGIYRGRDGALTMTFPDETISQLLVADLPKLQHTKSAGYVRQPTYQPPQSKFPPKWNMYLKRENLTAYVSKSLAELEQQSVLCHNRLCCDFSFRYTNLTSWQPYQYRGLVFDGVRTFDGVATGGIQACAIVACENETVTSCGVRVEPQHNFTFIAITGSFEGTSLQMPSTLQQADQLLPLSSSDFRFDSYCVNGTCQVAVTLAQPQEKLLTFGIYARDFERDGQPVTTPPDEPSEDSGAGQAFPAGFLILLSYFFTVPISQLLYCN